MPERRSTNFVKSAVFFYLARLLLLFRFSYTINFMTLSFSVFVHDGFLKKKTKKTGATNDGFLPNTLKTLFGLSRVLLDV